MSLRDKIKDLEKKIKVERFNLIINDIIGEVDVSSVTSLKIILDSFKIITSFNDNEPEEHCFIDEKQDLFCNYYDELDEQFDIIETVVSRLPNLKNFHFDVFDYPHGGEHSVSFSLSFKPQVTISSDTVKIHSKTEYLSRYEPLSSGEPKAIKLHVNFEIINPKPAPPMGECNCCRGLWD